MVRARVRQVARATGFLGITAVMVPPFARDLRRARPGEQRELRDAWVKRWASALLRLFAIEVDVEGAVPARSGARGRLLVANHRSAIDIGVLLATFGGKMVSRDDVAGWPIVGAAARTAGTVFVDRKNAESGAAAIRLIQNQLELGETVALFPEGTTFEGDDVRPFHGGAFVAAVRAEAEILPVGLAYPKSSGAAYVNETFVKHLGRVARSESTRMALAVGEPIAVTRKERAKNVAARAHDTVQALVTVARQRCGE